MSTMKFEHKPSIQ